MTLKALPGPPGTAKTWPCQSSGRSGSRLQGTISIVFNHEVGSRQDAAKGKICSIDAVARRRRSNIRTPAGLRHHWLVALRQLGGVAAALLRRCAADL